MYTEKLNVERCLKAMENIYVKGIPYKRRLYLIEEAIQAIQEYPKEALSTSYLGIKNYASFGDQRCDCQYGYGPKYGNIVFSIGRTDNSMGKHLGDDEIYFLECVRSFGSTTFETDIFTGGRGERTATLALPNLLKIYDRCRDLKHKYGINLDVNIDTHICPYEENS